MHREHLIQQLRKEKHYDLCIAGGGATGLGIAVDAASRGYKTLLIERSDFAKGTSSRSTKLVHGGVRYLQSGNIKLVYEALHERGILMKNAGHLVKNQSFIVPNYKWWEGAYYGLGLKIYDWMSGTRGLGASQLLSKEEVINMAPTLAKDGLRGGVLYHDGQFDDARLAVNLAQTAMEQGALVLNQMALKDFIKVDGRIIGCIAEDQLTGETFEIGSKVIVNATGVFSDELQQQDEPSRTASISPSQGIHIVLDRSFLPGDTAILVPQTDDKRVLFAVPWHDRIIVGTTDTPVSNISEEPIPFDQEVNYLLDHITRYLTRTPHMSDIKSVFAGLRPLIRADAKKTAEISRDHLILESPSGLMSIIGGKWTTYRRMAEDVLDTLIEKGRLPAASCITEDISIHGNCKTDERVEGYYYGSDIEAINQLMDNDESMRQLLHHSLPYKKAHVIHAIRNEFAMTIEDVLARRTRALLLDAAAAMECALRVGEIMREEMQLDHQWLDEQLAQFNRLARNYLPHERHVSKSASYND